MPHIFRSAMAVTLALVATGGTAGAQSTMTPSPASAVPMADNPPENSLVTARVRREFSAWQHGRIDRATYSPVAGGTYNDALVKVVEPDLAAIGEPQTVTYRTASLLLGDLVYRYEVSGTAGVISVLYSLDGRGKTDGIEFTPKIFTVAPSTP